MACINAVLFGTLMYRSGLASRIIPPWPYRAPLFLSANIAVLVGHNDTFSAGRILATLPIAAWELSVGTWMLVKGFKAAAVTAGVPDAPAGVSTKAAWPCRANARPGQTGNRIYPASAT